MAIAKIVNIPLHIIRNIDTGKYWTGEIWGEKEQAICFDQLPTRADYLYLSKDSKTYIDSKGDIIADVIVKAVVQIIEYKPKYILHYI